MIKETAKEEMGLVKPKTKKIKKYSDKIESPSKEQEEVRLKIENSKKLKNIIELKKKKKKKKKSTKSHKTRTETNKQRRN